MNGKVAYRVERQRHGNFSLACTLSLLHYNLTCNHTREREREDNHRLDIGSEIGDMTIFMYDKMMMMMMESM